MQELFLLQNVHFALNLFAAFVFFAVFWLHLDAWTMRKTKRQTIKLVGFLGLSFSYLLHALVLGQSGLVQSLFPADSLAIAGMVLRLGGYTAVMIGIIIDPLQKRPDTKPESTAVALAAGMKGLTLLSLGIILRPILCLSVALLYLRQATIGLERHLKPVSYTFFVLMLSEIVGMSELFAGSSSASILQFVRPFGPLWMVEHGLLLIALLILTRWVFRYLLERIQSQLFMLFSTMVLSIYLITAVSFTVVLLGNVQGEAEQHIATDVRVLEYAMNSKIEEVRSNAELVAQNPHLQQALVTGDKKQLAQISTTSLLAKKQSLLVVLSGSGVVVMRGEDTDKVGDSLSDDRLVKQVLQHSTTVASFITKEGILAPEVSVRAVAPILFDHKLIGAVMVGNSIDTAFVDGVKKVTGLDASIYAGSVRSATTFASLDGKTRLVGVKEDSPVVKKTVLQQGKAYIKASNYQYY